MLAWVVIFTFIDFVSVKAENTAKIDLIKGFIHNEQKPTHLVFNLCWGKEMDIKLTKKLSDIGVRTTQIFEPADHLKQATLFLLDLQCPEVEEYIFRATSHHLFSFPYRWLVFANSSQDKEQSPFQDMPLYADSDFVLAEATGYGYRLIELHKPSTKTPIQTTIRGYFNGSLSDVRPHRTLFRRRKDVMGHPLRMVNVIQDSNTTQYHLLQEDRLEQEYDFIAKSSWSTVKIAFEMLNATPRYSFSHRWGYNLNGTWSGMINDLKNYEGDVGTNCLLKKDRLSIVVFTDNLVPFRVRFVFRQPPLSFVSNIFALPFASGVWVALFVCAVASTLGVYAASFWETQNNGKSSSQLDGSISDAMLLTMSALSQQGCVLEPRKASGRIMMIFLFAALMSLYAAYAANIVVLLQAPSNSIRTLAQLAYSKITLAALDVDYNHFAFKLNKDDPVRYEIFKRVDPEKGRKQFYDLDEGVEKIRQGLFAFHGIVEQIYKRIEETFLENEKCDLAEVDFFRDYDPYTPVKRDSPYMELLRVVFKQIRESGIRDAISKRLRTPKPKCAQKLSAFSSVGLLDLRPVIILMLYGVALSFVILLAEIAVFRLRESRRKMSATFMTSLRKLRIERQGV